MELGWRRRWSAEAKLRIVEDSFYTYVISDNLFAPEWVPPDATWVPWGDERMPKATFFRNILPAADFNHAAQAAIEAGCALPPPFGSPEAVPTERRWSRPGRCTQKIMGEYHPVAAWCDEELFIEGDGRRVFGRPASREHRVLVT